MPVALPVSITVVLVQAVNTVMGSTPTKVVVLGTIADTLIVVKNAEDLIRHFPAGSQTE